MKKLLASATIAGVLVLGSAAAATAATGYPDGGGPAITDTTPAIGQSITITITGLPAEWNGLFVTFTIVSGPSGGQLSSIVLAAAPVSTTKEVSNGTASASFSSNVAGSFRIAATGPNGEDLGTVGFVVGEPADAGDGLPPTGGAVPVGVIWLGVGAVGAGGVVVAATALRRRARNN